MRSFRRLVISVIGSFELELESDSRVVYKIQSENHNLLETPVHTHRIDTSDLAASRSNRRSIRHCCKQIQ